MRFRLTPRSITLDDLLDLDNCQSPDGYFGNGCRGSTLKLNCYKFEFSENFAGFCSFGRQQQLNVGLLFATLLSRAYLSHGYY